MLRAGTAATRAAQPMPLPLEELALVWNAHVLLWQSQSSTKRAILNAHADRFVP